MASSDYLFAGERTALAYIHIQERVGAEGTLCALDYQQPEDAHVDSYRDVCPECAAVFAWYEMEYMRQWADNDSRLSPTLT